MRAAGAVRGGSGGGSWLSCSGSGCSGRECGFCSLRAACAAEAREQALRRFLQLARQPAPQRLGSRCCGPALGRGFLSGPATLSPWGWALCTPSSEADGVGGGEGRERGSSGGKRESGSGGGDYFFIGGSTRIKMNNTIGKRKGHQQIHTTVPHALAPVKCASTAAQTLLQCHQPRQGA